MSQAGTRPSVREVWQPPAAWDSGQGSMPYVWGVQCKALCAHRPLAAALVDLLSLPEPASRRGVVPICTVWFFLMFGKNVAEASTKPLLTLTLTPCAPLVRLPYPEPRWGHSRQQGWERWPAAHLAPARSPKTCEGCPERVVTDIL